MQVKITNLLLQMLLQSIDLLLQITDVTTNLSFLIANYELLLQINNCFLTNH